MCPFPPKGGAGATPRHLRYGAAGKAGGLPEGPPPPPGPQRRRRRHPTPPGAPARRGRPVAYPKGRPHPQDPKGGAGATPRHPALRRGEGARRPTRRAAPTVKKVTPRPLR